MKKLLVALILILACVIFVVGCNTNRENENSDSSTDTVTETEKNEASSDNEGGDNTTESESTTKAETETQTAADVEAETKKGITASCVVKKGNRYVIVLPISGKSIPVGSSYTKYLSQVTDELVRAAEAKITEQVEALGETPEWSIEKNEDGELCLSAEVIKSIEGADENGEGGCGIDHEHFFFAESIIGE